MPGFLRPSPARPGRPLLRALRRLRVGRGGRSADALRPPRRLLQFGRARSGSVLVIVGIMLPTLATFAAAAVEYGRLVQRRAQLQAAADDAALTGANQLKLAGTNDTSIADLTSSIARARAATPADRTTSITSGVLGTRMSVKVVLRETVPTLMGRMLSLPSMNLEVSATAKLSGTTKLCALALDRAVEGALHLEKDARLTATNCTVYSNSASPRGLQGGDRSALTALTACSAGGYDGARANFTPVPLTDCPAIEDPLRSRAAPHVGDCISLSPNANPKSKGVTSYQEATSSASNAWSALVTHAKGGAVNVVNASVTLEPGTYCGGLQITDGARVTLNPGTYVMLNGPLLIDKKAEVTGQGVAFYFSGDQAGLLFDKDSTVSLTAPRTGEMAGLLMAEDRNVGTPVIVDNGLTLPIPLPPTGAPAMRQYRIISNNARVMIGTIYLPVGRLVVDADRAVADQSAYTVIVARMIDLYNGPNLTLNADYGASDVPVPRGVGPTSGSVTLSQ